MVKILSKAYGTIEIDSKQIVSFPEGLFAFENFKKYAIITKPDSIFSWLQSLDDVNLAFLVIDPTEIISDYEPKVTADLLTTIEATEIKSLHMLSILTIPQNQPEKMTMNLQGPLLINAEKAVGAQVVSANDLHLVKTPLFELLQKSENA